MANKYIVVKGDTLGAIAKRNGMTLDQLIKLNPDIKDPNKISIGQTIILAEGSGGGGETQPGSSKGLLSVPGADEAQVWKVGDDYYLVYVIPGTEPPVYVGWKGLTEENVQSWFGPDQAIVADRVLDEAGAKKVGLVVAGTDVELANFDENPFATWLQTMETQAKVQPWILDDDYQALLLEATLEGRAISEAEIQGTEWWQGHNSAQRSWMKVFHGDPVTAQQMIDDNRLMAAELLKAAGVENPSEELIWYMADQATMGNWSEVYFNSQVNAVADPHSGIEVDEGLINLVGEAGGTQGEEDTVKRLLQEWLGPVYGAWDQKQIADWAGKLRNDPDAELNFIEHLQDQRMALFPEYEDRNVSYNAMATPWRQFMQTSWGQKADETDPIFQTLLKNNDAHTNGQLLIEEGLNRGIGKVMNEMNSGALRQSSGLVRRAV